jgi:hypothetical protein
MVLANVLPRRNLLILDVELGTGRTEDALLAQTTGSSIMKVLVFLFLISAKPLTDQVLAFHAMRDTT